MAVIDEVSTMCTLIYALLVQNDSNIQNLNSDLEDVYISRLHTHMTYGYQLAYPAIEDKVKSMADTNEALIQSTAGTTEGLVDNAESMIDTNEALIASQHATSDGLLSLHETAIYDAIVLGSGVAKTRITQATMDNAVPPAALGLCLSDGSGLANVWVYATDSSNNFLWAQYSNSDGSYEIFVSPGLGSISIHYTYYGWAKSSRTVTV